MKLILGAIVLHSVAILVSFVAVLVVAFWFVSVLDVIQII